MIEAGNCRFLSAKHCWDFANADWHGNTCIPTICLQYLFDFCTYIHTNVRTYIRRHISYIRSYVAIYAHTHIRTYTYIRTYVHTYIRTIGTYRYMEVLATMFKFLFLQVFLFFAVGLGGVRKVCCPCVFALWCLGRSFLVILQHMYT